MKEQVVYGAHAVRALFERGGSPSALWVQDGKAVERYADLISLAREKKIAIHVVSGTQLTTTFGEVVHQGIVARAQLRTFHEADWPLLLEKATRPPLILILDGVTDPHNLGACLRTADAAGVLMVIAPKDNSVGITPVVSKVASGAAEAIPFIQVTNLARTMQQLQEKGVWLYGAAPEATCSIWQVDFQGPSGLVLGAEGAGLRRLTKTHCDGLFSLPMQGQVASLNVSVATGVCVYEVVRQRGAL